MENPIQTLLSLLKIPIDSTVDFNTYVEIIFNDANLGVIPSYPTPGNRMFDTSEAVLNKLRWDFVYISEKEYIDQAIARFFHADRQLLQITLGTFRKLYVRDNNENIIGSVTCVFSDGEWSIFPGQSQV